MGTLECGWEVLGANYWYVLCSFDPDLWIMRLSATEPMAIEIRLVYERVNKDAGRVDIPLNFFLLSLSSIFQFFVDFWRMLECYFRSDHLLHCFIVRFFALLLPCDGTNWHVLVQWHLTALCCWWLVCTSNIFICRITKVDFCYNLTLYRYSWQRQGIRSISPTKFA